MKKTYEKNYKIYILVLYNILLLVIFFSVGYYRLYYSTNKETPIVSDNVVEYEYKKTNLLGLKKLQVDGNEYIYQFSSSKFFNKIRVNEIKNDPYTSYIGLYKDKDSLQIIEISLSDVIIYNSGNNAFIIISNNVEQYDFLGFYIFYNTRKRIGVLYDKEPVVSKATLYYDYNVVKQISQKYTNNKWGKPSKYAAPINPYR